MMQQYVEAPALALGERRGSLLSSIPLGTDERWTDGVVWIADPEEGGNGAWIVCEDDLVGEGDDGTGDDDECPEFGTAQAINIVAFERGGSRAGLSVGGWQARANAKLERGSSTYLEQELWTAPVAQAAGLIDNPRLASTDFNFEQIGSGSDTFGVKVGFATLQKEAMADYGDPVVIHASPRLISLWDGNGGTIIQDGTRLRDIYGNLIIAGAGYDGSGPGGDVDPTYEWAYATGPVSVWLGPINSLGDAGAILDRRTNRQVAYATRDALAVFNPVVHKGVRIDLCEGCLPA